MPSRVLFLGVAVIAAADVVWLTKALLAQVPDEAIVISLGVGALLIVGGSVLQLTAGREGPEEGE